MFVLTRVYCIQLTQLNWDTLVPGRFPIKREGVQINRKNISVESVDGILGMLVPGDCPEFSISGVQSILHGIQRMNSTSL